MTIFGISFSVWTLLNLLCLVWVCLIGVLGTVLIRAMYDGRTWIPNKLAVVLDAIIILLLSIAVITSCAVAMISLAQEIAYVTALLNLCLSLLLIGCVVSSYFIGIRLPENISVRFKSQGECKTFHKEVTVVACGDVCFDQRYGKPNIIRPKSLWGNLMITLSWFVRKPALPIPRLNTGLKDSKRSDGPLQINAEQVTISNKNQEPLTSLPFSHVKKIFREADVSYVNLEGPFADNSRFEPYRLMNNPAYVNSIKDVGIDIIGFANNHCFDAEESGFLTTLDLLDKNDLKYTGSGYNLDHARKGAVSNVKGVKIAWLGYTQKIGRVTLDYAVATNERAGCLPLDPSIIEADIIRARQDADIVIIVPHWGVEDYHCVSRQIRKLAHWMIDVGADAIFGHGPHLYQGIEVYKDRPIAYSLGTLIFGLWFKTWKDNMLVRLTLANSRPSHLEIIPISGSRDTIFHPHVLTGERAQNVLKHVKKLSRSLGTNVRIEDDIGVVDIS